MPSSRATCLQTSAVLLISGNNSIRYTINNGLPFILIYLLSLKILHKYFMCCILSSTPYFCSNNTSLSIPSHRLVQFSLAQHRQKGKSGLPDERTSLKGRSNILRPLNQ